MLFFALLGAASLPYQGNVSWDDIRATEGCFFFSGPLELGRDDHLGVEATITPGPVTTVAFGPHTFRGPRGEPLVRESGHDFQGAWVVRESLRGTWSADGFAGTYRYQEREHRDEGWGRCAITAHVSIRAE
jgi:hypothetical protein